MNFDRLAITYVTGRRKRGEIARCTADQYLGRLLDFAAHAPDDVRDVKQRHVEAWLALPCLDGRQPSPHYQRVRLTAIRTFWRWLVAHEHADRDPSMLIDLGRMPKLIPRSLLDDEPQRVMAACADDRARLMALLMLQCGLRRAEVAAIRLEDIDRRRRILRVRGKGGEGGVTRTTYLVDEVQVLLGRYLPSVADSSGPLFRSHREPWSRRHLHPATVYECVVGAMKAAGVKQAAWDGKVPHALRHTHAHDLIDRGVDVKVVQESLGHARLATTDIYTVGSVKSLSGPLEGRSYLT